MIQIPSDIFAPDFQIVLNIVGMKMNVKKNLEQETVSGQAEAVFDILVRSGNLPPKLSLSIEEILERAWELAYHRKPEIAPSNVVTLEQFKACRKPSKRSRKAS